MSQSVHLSVLFGFKVATVVFTLIGAAIVAMDPTVKVAIIVAAPSMLAGIGTIILGFMNRTKLQDVHESAVRMESNVNGKLSKLLEVKQELSNTQQTLAHAEGHREATDEIRHEADEIRHEIDEIRHETDEMKRS